MLDAEFLRTARAQFAIVGPPVTEDVILSVFPKPFPGREDLIQFYLAQNGGGRTEQSCLAFCAIREHIVPRERVQQVRVECFLSIFQDANEKVPPFGSILKVHATMARIYASVPEMAAFLESHTAVARDHSGRDLCVNTANGSVWFLDWKEYKLGPIEIASSFRDFVEKFWNAGPGEDFPRHDQ